MLTFTDRDHLIFRWIGVGLIGLIILVFLWPKYLSRPARISRYIHAQARRLQSCQNFPEAIRIADYTRRFPNGTWVAVISTHACDPGTGFNATIFRNDQGQIQVDQSHHFCGREGLENELKIISASSAQDFYNNLPKCQLTPVP